MHKNAGNDKKYEFLVPDQLQNQVTVYTFDFAPRILPNASPEKRCFAPICPAGWGYYCLRRRLRLGNSVSTSHVPRRRIILQLTALRVTSHVPRRRTALQLTALRLTCMRAVNRQPWFPRGGLVETVQQILPKTPKFDIFHAKICKILIKFMLEALATAFKI